MSFVLSDIKENTVEERVEILNEFQVTSGVILSVIFSGDVCFVDPLCW
jgi:hypothetical protein